MDFSANPKRHLHDHYIRNHGMDISLLEMHAKYNRVYASWSGWFSHSLVAPLVIHFVNTIESIWYEFELYLVGFWFKLTWCFPRQNYQNRLSVGPNKMTSMKLQKHHSYLFVTTYKSNYYYMCFQMQGCYNWPGAAYLKHPRLVWIKKSLIWRKNMWLLYKHWNNNALLTILWRTVKYNQPTHKLLQLKLMNY